MGVGPEEFRDAAKRFATGVTVVTVAADDKPHGMTATSFAAVSLEPPLVLVCLEKRSQTLAKVLQKGSFAVNVLGSSQEPVARAFAAAGPKPFDSLAHRVGVHGDPLFDDAIAWFECVVKDTVDAGDHDVVIAHVDACSAGDGAPLLHYDRAYRSVGAP